MNKDKIKVAKELKRKSRVRAKISGTNAQPRLAVFRSLKHIYAQIIDDAKGVTLVSAADTELKAEKMKKVDKAKAVGKLIAEKALVKKISQVVYDRGGNKYHGRVKALAEGAREGGLKF